MTAPPAPAGEPTPAAGDAAAVAVADQQSPWDDARLPWKGQPSRADLLCWAGFSLTGLYGLIMLPLRPVLIGGNPVVLAGLTGSSGALVAIGALAATGVGSWYLPLALATIGVMKFDALFWWAGKLWGRGLVEIIAGRSPRAGRAADRAERLARRFGVLALLLTYFPIPFPSPVVYATLGASGMRLRTFLLVDLTGALLSRAAYVWLGFALGQRAVDVVDVIAKYSLWVSVVLVLGIFVGVWRRRGSQ